MQAQRIEYKGYLIQPLASPEDVGRHYGAYEITKDGKMVSARANIFPGFVYRDAALADSIEHAKLEIDNLSST